MSKKLMMPFLTEWLIKHGDTPIGLQELGVYNMAIFYKALRKGYICQLSGGDFKIRLTRDGMRYLQENQK